MLHTFALYMIAVLTINFLPGPDMLFVMSQSINHGKRFGLAAALGIGSGCFVHIFAVTVGLSSLLVKSSLAFSIVKYIGAAYLIYLGITSLLKKKSDVLTIQSQDNTLTWKNTYLKGCFTNILNPKVALFFLAFLPQFVSPTLYLPISAQLLILGVIFTCSGTLINILVAYFFGAAKKWLSSHPAVLNIQQKITGAILIGFGFRLATLEKI